MIKPYVQEKLQIGQIRRALFKDGKAALLVIGKVNPISATCEVILLDRTTDAASVRDLVYVPKVSDEFIYRTVKSVCTGLSVELKMSDPVNSAIFSKVTPHWLRHTSATHQVDAGIDLRVVQQNLRHSSISTTMHYQHTSNDHRFEETNIKFSTRN